MADISETNTNPGENKMGTMPVKRLIVTMSLPMMISMLVQALYNIVDSIFVSEFSEDALNAVSIIFPIQNLMIAFASGTGVGINAMLSKALGAKEKDEANLAANNGIFLNIFNTLLFVIIGLFFTDFYMGMLSESEAIAQFGHQYMSIICIFSIGCFFQVTFERLLQSTGRTVQCMISQATGAIINIVLDPLLIFGIGFFPHMGVAGAAAATVIGQCCAAILAIIFNIKYNADIHLSLKRIFSPKRRVITRIYAVGVPSIMMMSIGSVMTFLMNKILLGFSSTAQTVFGVYFKLQSFFFMPIFGLNNGLIPVLAYNYGARNRERIQIALRFSVVLAMSIMTVGSVIFLALPEVLLDMFKANATMLSIGIPALRIISLHFPVAAICIVLGSTFQAFSRSLFSLFVSLARQLVVLIPAAWLLALTGNVVNVWWSFPIAEVASLVMSLTFFRKIKSSIIDTL